MCATRLEIEAKYAVPDTRTFAHLLSLTELGAYRLQPIGEVVFTDHYLDTEDRALHRGGHACRLRQMEGRCFITLEVLDTPHDAMHHREEHEMHVAADARQPQAWPDGRARDLVLSLSDSKPLVELLVIQQRRARRELWHGERRVGELCLDTVDLGPDQSTGHDVEIELGQLGTLDDLRAMSEALEVHELRPAGPSKFERALALLDGTPAAAEPSSTEKRRLSGVRADMPMAEAGRAVLRLHFEAMLAHEERTSGGDIDALHDMRVASRRQRAAFRIFDPCYKRKIIRPFRRELRRLAGSLGVVRDLDVQLDALRAYQASQPAGPAEALQPLLDDWLGEREAARGELIAYLGSEEYRAFKLSYAEFLATCGAGVQAPAGLPSRVQDELPQVVWQRYDAVRAYAAVLPWATVETLHALRIEGKRLRYALEFFLDVLGPRGEKLVADVVALQDHIGELHDTDVALQRLQAFLLRRARGLAPEASKAIGGYAAACQARLRALQRTIGQPWRHIDSNGFRRLLSRVTARRE
jgi:CHAD domain-containing protein/uncharacterized protein YjbK